jgi:hypothetical protein
MDICVRIGWLALPFFSVDVLSGVVNSYSLTGATSWGEPADRLRESSELWSDPETIKSQKMG